MKIIVGGRRTGKTTALLKEAAEHNAVIVTTDKHRAEILFNQARDLGLSIRMPVSLQDLKRSRLAGSFVNSLYIDEAEYVLAHLLGDMTGGRGHLDAITINLAELNSTLVMTSNDGEATYTQPKEKPGPCFRCKYRNEFGTSLSCDKWHYETRDFDSCSSFEEDRGKP